MTDDVEEYTHLDGRKRDERQPGELAFNAKLSPDRTLVLFVVERDEGIVQMELGRAEVVRLAQTLLAMAGVMRDD